MFQPIITASERPLSEMIYVPITAEHTLSRTTAARACWKKLYCRY